ncbi:hypothetical protein RT723_01665 [Psychrosphaera aquimarina]|uniref:Uncharacterized protein n=1 Tax=Psychrosphaera aquimarina TaxID=2044854 RepID=A0ABU3QWC4_9GAMM|nr:hypothetical protein [Psychrosphaera aquimarina]MDU0111737.1 hypothetical protein [Psychrosphaera aquimarina]
MKNLVIFSLSFISYLAHANQPVEVIPPQHKVLGSENGRFVFGQVSSFRSDQYLLDTHTGRMWQIVENKDKQSVLRPVPIKQLFGEEAYIPEPVERDEAFRDMLRTNTMEKMKQENAKKQSD